MSAAETTCKTCDGRGFVFRQVDPLHRIQLDCPDCHGAQAAGLALLLSGEKLPEGWKAEDAANAKWHRKS